MSYSNPARTAKEDAAQYIQSLLDLLGDRDPLVTLPELPGKIEALIAGLDDAQLRTAERQGKWSVIEVVQHLADTELVYGYRMRKTLAHPGTAISGYDQDAWSQSLRYKAAQLDLAMGQLRALRAANVALFNTLTPEEWERAGMHNERGPESLRQISRLVAGHDFLHCNQIARIKIAIGQR